MNKSIIGTAAFIIGCAIVLYFDQILSALDAFDDIKKLAIGFFIASIATLLLMIDIFSYKRKGGNQLVIYYVFTILGACILYRSKEIFYVLSANGDIFSWLNEMIIRIVAFLIMVSPWIFRNPHNIGQSKVSDDG